MRKLNDPWSTDLFAARFRTYFWYFLPMWLFPAAPLLLLYVGAGGGFALMASVVAFFAAFGVACIPYFRRQVGHVFMWVFGTLIPFTLWAVAVLAACLVAGLRR